MSECATAAQGSIRRALLDYRPSMGARDELLGSDGRPRPRWAPLLEASVVNQSGDETDTARPWQLDPFPYIADLVEWRTIEQGLLQRSRLLNALVADFYGAQKLLRDHGLPPALLFANPGYLPQCRGYRARGGVFLNLIAFDLGRSPDGQWRVLANHADAPVGLGYALDNRIVTARLLPDALDSVGIAPLDGFFDALANTLRERVPGARDSVSVILSDVAHQGSYADHALLGRSLGIAVVAGSALAVVPAGVQLTTPDGAKPVRTIIRGIDSLSSDPLELSSASLQGTPGLLASAALGHVQISNAIGSRAVENRAIAAFLPGLCQTLFNESLMLPDLATWWCGQPREAGHVAAHLDTLVVRRAFERDTSAVDDTFARLLPAPGALDVEAIQRNIAQRPYDYVGREPMLLATTPYWEGDRLLRPAPFTLRLFVAATGDGYRLLPGGLALATTPRGIVSKDVWVTDGPRSPAGGRR